MFGTISFEDFIKFTAFFVIIYAFIVIYLFYSGEIKRICFWKKDNLDESNRFLSYDSINLLPIVHELVTELRVIIREASENKTPTPDLLFFIQYKFKDYVLLEPTEYKGKVNFYVVEELESRGFQNIKIEDIENLWNL